MRRIILICALLVVGLALAGCSDRAASSRSGTSGSSTSGSSTSSSGTSGSGPSQLDSAPVPADASGFAHGSGLASTPTLMSAPDTRQVITSGSVSMTVDSPVSAADAAARVTETAGGHVDSRVERAAVDGEPGTATLALRIPSAGITATLDALKKLGHVQTVSLEKKDVTATSLDLDARITALRTSSSRLTSLMTTAASTTDLITIESALAERQSTLESLESQARSLAGQIEFSTITLDLHTIADVPVKAPADFFSGLVTGFSAFLSFFTGVIVVVGVLVPWILSLGILAAVAWLIAKRRRRGDPSSAPADTTVSSS